MLKPLMEDHLSSDPDNMPPRSRLFLVVPKTAEARVIQVGSREHRLVLLRNSRRDIWPLKLPFDANCRAVDECS